MSLSPSRPAGARALADAILAALQQDPAVHVLDEAVDLSQPGLRAAFPDRVHRLPAADASLLGVAVGMAMAGARPIVRLAGPEAVWGALQQLGQEAAALSTHLEFRLPLIVRVPLAPGQADPTPLLLGIPGLTVAAPGQAGEAAGLLRAALQATGPVVLLEPLALLAETAQELAPLPLGAARTLRSGAHATALAWGAGAAAALAAAEALAGEGVELEVLDLRSAPVDAAAIAESVSRTGRAVLVGSGDAALLAAVRGAFLRLEAPPAEVGPHADAVADAVRAALRY